VVTVRSELGDDVDSMRVEVRDAADTTTSDTKQFSRSQWLQGERFSFGVQRAAQSAFVVKVTAYQGKDFVAEAKLRFSFSSKRTTRETLWLRQACRGVACGDGSTCDAHTSACGAIGGAGGTGTDTSQEPMPVAGMAGASGHTIAGAGGAVSSMGKETLGMAGSGRGTGGMQAGAAGRGMGGNLGPGGPSGAAGAAPVDGGPVSGTLLDFYRRPVRDIEVQVDDRKSRTDDQGRFHFDNVSTSYDVSYVIPAASANGALAQVQLWLYRGLTRRDPTLQCYIYPTVLRTTNVHIQVPALTSGQAALIAFGSVDGTGEWWLSNADTQSSLSWWGPMENVGTLHALQAMWDSTSSEYKYAGYQEQAQVLGGSTVELNYTFAAESVPTFRVSGTVSSPGLRKRQNQAWVRWDDGAGLYVNGAQDPGDQIAFPIPVLPNARGALMAIEGAMDSNGFIIPPYGAVFVDDLTAPTTELALTIPKPPQLLAPADAMEGVDAGTAFQWSDADGVGVLSIQNDTHMLFIVTKGGDAAIPTMAFEAPFSLPLNTMLNWNVGVYGAFSDVDRATSSGFLQGVWSLDFRGPVHGSGPMAWGDIRKLTTAR
jgi:hypothetical protein